jgi:YD repeat-containing protein
MKKLVLLAIFSFFSTSYAVDLGKGQPYDYLHVHVAPDPVNARNGNFYLPLPDYYQSCFGFPLEVYRSYNSFSTRNGSFGYGWTFNYDIQIVVGEKGSLQIVEPDGFVNEYIAMEAAELSTATVIKKIVEARKKEDVEYTKKKDGKGAEFYQELEQRLRKEPEFLKRQRERYLGAQKETSTSGKYVSYNRGTTYVTKTSAGYTRVSETGQSEEYNKEGYITKIADRNGNALTFSYNQKSKLSKVADGCGNYISISYNANEKISKIRDALSREMSYQYDKDLNLILSTGIDKQSIAYTYDKLGRMDTILFKDDNSKTTIQYDPKNGRVIAQNGPGTKKTTYEYAKIPNGISTRIKDNQGENILYEYIDKENKVSQTDANKVKTTTVLSECCGKPVLIENSQGVKDSFEYDDKGNIVSITDAKGAKTLFEYEPRFSQPSMVQYSNGETIRYRYDQIGNLTFAKKSLGKTSSQVKITYESHGKMVSIIDEEEQEVKFEYSSIGKPVSIALWKTGQKVSEIRVKYNKEGDMDSLQYIPNKPETGNMVREALKRYLLLLKPAGIDFEI